MSKLIISFLPELKREPLVITDAIQDGLITDVERLNLIISLKSGQLKTVLLNDVAVINHEFLPSEVGTKTQKTSNVANEKQAKQGADEEALRVPEKHIEPIRELAKKLNGQPRYALAQALVRSLKGTGEEISLQTALDYVNSSVNEGHLKKMGMNLFPA